MKYIVVLPDNDYFVWQMLVQITNFRELGIEEDAIFIVGYFSTIPNRHLTRIMEDPSIKCRIVTYKDMRPLRRYPSSLRPHLLSRFFADNPDVAAGTYFYMDPDVVFTKKPLWEGMLDNDTWYQSATPSYMNIKYITSKGEGFLETMMDIVGVTREQVEATDEHAGGVQYLLKNTSSSFWEKVYIDCENMYSIISDMSNKKYAERRQEIANLRKAIEDENGPMDDEQLKKFNNENRPYHPLQIWTADMWCVWWNALYFGKDIKSNDEMEFCWAGWQTKDWERLTIFHNAGIPSEDGRNFCKVTWQSSPFNKEINVSEESASYQYLQLVKRTETLFPDLIW